MRLQQLNSKTIIHYNSDRQESYIKDREVPCEFVCARMMRLWKVLKQTRISLAACFCSIIDKVQSWLRCVSRQSDVYTYESISECSEGNELLE